MRFNSSTAHKPGYFPSNFKQQSTSCKSRHLGTVKVALLNKAVFSDIIWKKNCMLQNLVFVELQNVIPNDSPIKPQKIVKLWEIYKKHNFGWAIRCINSCDGHNNFKNLFVLNIKTHKYHISLDTFLRYQTSFFLIRKGLQITTLSNCIVL